MMIRFARIQPPLLRIRLSGDVGAGFLLLGFRKFGLEWHRLVRDS